MRKRSGRYAFVLAGVVLLGGCTATRSLLGVPPPSPPGIAPPAPAGGIDELLVSSWLKADIKIAPAASDAEFLRRASLDLLGRVPTLPETRAFLADRAADRRLRLVDRLLASPELAEHFADVYSDLLWRTEGNKRIERQDPRSWLVQAFNENRPYDRIVTDLLTATGDIAGNGAGAFIAARARGGGGPEAVAGAAARLFLGLQIQCAQCHDHPYDARWKQEDFYGLVAYFARTRVRRERNMAFDMMDAGPPGLAVVDQRRGEARMRPPRSETDVVVPPRFLGRVLAAAPDESRRQTLARAVVESDLFAKTMVARTWAQLFGQGLVDPWDDLGAENDERHPPLLSRLAEKFRASGHDVKVLLREIVLSPAYARSSARPDGSPDDGGAAVRAFAQARVRPLTPEQLFRSLLTVTGAEDMLRRRDGLRVEAQAGGGGRVPYTVDRVERQIERALREYRFTFEDDEMADSDTFDGSMPQALLLLNGEVTNSGTRAGEDGVLDTILRSSRDPAQRLQDIFLAVYARPPTVEEARWLLPQLADATPAAPARGGGARRAYEDLFFSLLISSESVTNH
jgi:hypothetical protein